MIRIVETPHYTVDRDSGRQLFIYTRTAVPLPVNDPALHAPALQVLRSIDRNQWSLLLDVRLAPMRDAADETSESALRSQVAPLMQGFRRQAVVVRTAVGALQVARMARASSPQGGGEEVLRDYDEAVAWLTAPA
jgi:hypothetical protein